MVEDKLLVEYKSYKLQKQEALVRKAQERIEKEKNLGSLKKQKKNKSRVAPAPALDQLGNNATEKAQLENGIHLKLAHAQQLAVGELTILLDTVSKKVEVMSKREQKLFDLISRKVRKPCGNMDDAMGFIEELQQSQEVMQVVHATAARMIGAGGGVKSESDTGLGSETKETGAAESNTAMEWLLTNSYTFFFLVMGVWIGGGTCFYHYQNNWPWAHSFYYTTQSCLSIGFGALEDTNDTSKLFTTGNIFFGAAFGCTALSFFAQAAVREHERINTLITESQIFGVIEGTVEGLGGGTGQAVQGKLMNGCCSGLKRGLCATSDLTVALAFFLIWIVGGWVYAWKRMGMSLVTSLLFSVSACSTGGIVPPPTDEASMWFTGAFILTGVPIFGFSLAQLSSAVLRPWMAHRIMAKMQEELDPEDILAADQGEMQPGVGYGRLNWGVFFEYKLRQIALIDDRMIMQLKRKFREVSKGDGFIDIADLRHSIAQERRQKREGER
jgi:hypothetical protein